MLLSKLPDQNEEIHMFFRIDDGSICQMPVEQSLAKKILGPNIGKNKLNIVK